MYTQNQIESALLALFEVEPPKFHKELFRDYETILKYLHLLRYSAFNEYLIASVVRAMLPFVEQNKRFQRKALIKLLKGHMRKRPPKRKLKAETVDLLFTIFKLLILRCNVEMANDLSVILKNIELKNCHIQWLIDNADKSPYVLNRLLRYPTTSPLISDWAAKAYKLKQFRNRQSEIVSHIENFYDDHLQISVNPISFVWAIYYAKIDTSLKEALLLKCLNTNIAEPIIEVASRLKLASPLKCMLNMK